MGWAIQASGDRAAGRAEHPTQNRTERCPASHRYIPTPGIMSLLGGRQNVFMIVEGFLFILIVLFSFYRAVAFE